MGKMLAVNVPGSYVAGMDILFFRNLGGDEIKSTATVLKILQKMLEKSKDFINLP